MDNNRVEGIGHRLKGAVKQGLGRLIGDAKLQADGAAERTKGDAQSVAASSDPVIGIDADRITGVGHQIKGAVKESLGDLVNDPKLRAAGVAERQAGRAQNAAGSARDEVRDVSKQ